MPHTRRVPADPWSRLMADSTRLWCDATMVVMLRAFRMMAGGPAAAREAERMVGEKVDAGFELAGALASGQVTTPHRAARKAMTAYGRRVRSNRKRLG